MKQGFVSEFLYHGIGEAHRFLTTQEYEHAAAHAIGSIPHRHHRRPEDFVRFPDANQEDDESQQILQHAPRPLDDSGEEDGC